MQINNTYNNHQSFGINLTIKDPNKLLKTGEAEKLITKALEIQPKNGSVLFDIGALKHSSDTSTDQMGCQEWASTTHKLEYKMTAASNINDELSVNDLSQTSTSDFFEEEITDEAKKPYTVLNNWLDKFAKNTAEVKKQIQETISNIKTQIEQAKLELENLKTNVKQKEEDYNNAVKASNNQEANINLLTQQLAAEESKL